MNKLANLIAGVENRIKNRINHFSTIAEECENENRNIINYGYKCSIARNLLIKHEQKMKKWVEKAKNDLITFKNDCAAYINQSKK